MKHPEDQNIFIISDPEEFFSSIKLTNPSREDQTISVNETTARSYLSADGALRSELPRPVDGAS
jgi:hypothetical protein